MRLVLDDPKVTTPEITDQIHELILEDRRISAKSMAEQLYISRERVGSIIQADLDMRKLSAKWVPKCLNADQNFNGDNRLSKFWNFFGANQMTTCRASWQRTSHGYITMTRRQSNSQWNGGSHRPKTFRVQKSAGKFLVSILWDQDGILPTDYLPKGQIINAENSLSLLVQVMDILKKKRRGMFTKGGLVVARQCPDSPGTCNPDETGLPWLPVSYLPTLFCGSGPFGLATVPWTENTVEISLFFFRRGGHCCRGDLVGRTTFAFFFWVASKTLSIGPISVLWSMLNKSRVCSL